MCHIHYMYPTVSCQKYSQSTAGIITRLEAVLLTTERFTVQSVILDICTFFMFTSCKNWILVTAFPQAKRVISFFQSWFYHVCVVYLKKKILLKLNKNDLIKWFLAQLHIYKSTKMTYPTLKEFCGLNLVSNIQSNVTNW